MCENKFVLTESETLHLLEQFCFEALCFLEVPREEYPEVVNGVAFDEDGKALPISVDYRNNKIIVCISYFRMMLLSNPQVKNDSPTIYRSYGYKLAYVWFTYIVKGMTVDFVKDVESSIFAESLKVIKGIPIRHVHVDKVSSHMLDSIIGYNPNDKTPVLKMLRENLGMDCLIREGYDHISKERGAFITFSSKEHQRRSKKYWNLYDESISRPTPAMIAEGELGSETNPFDNVDAAAEYILKIEQEYLKSDRYRQRIDNEQYYYDYEHGCFRISWASPNVGYYELTEANYPCFVVNQLSPRFIGGKMQIPRFSIKPSLRNNKFLYRGQAEFYSPCKPSLFREKHKNYFVDDIIQMNELEILLQQHPLVKLFEEGFMLMNEFIRFKINYDGLSQHYYNKTPLLDLTNDMEVAKFFAVTTFDMDNDRYLPYDGDKLGVLYYYDIKPDTFNYSKGRRYHIDAIGKQPFMRSGNQYGFLIDLEKDDDFNNLPEVRYVFFKHDPSITERIFKGSRSGDKYMPQEILRTNWHRRMNDEEARKKVSMKALKLNFKNNPDESHSKIVKKLQEKGFSISSKHTPCFTEEELNLYYTNSIKIWEDFCSDIHFYGPEGLLLKKHLHNLPNDPRYRWAFYKDANQG